MAGLPAKTVPLAAAGSLSLGALALVLPSVASGHWSDGLRFLLYMLSATAVAIIVGLMFGVPRVRSEFVADASERYASNSNLEQISDWFTKLLLGAGLVEMSRVPQLASRLGTYLASGLPTPNAPALAVAAVVYGNGVGFTIGYLWARLRLRVFLETSDRMAADASIKRDISENLRLQNERHAAPERETDLARAADAGIRAREAIGRGSIAPILWVDDVPGNNTAIIASLRSLDIEVRTARSTSESLELLTERSYGLIISDLGRQEGLTYNPTAGLDLIAAIRARDAAVPIFIFGTHRALDMQEELQRAGATLVTTRASVLFERAAETVTLPAS
jgi:CheY-like chemotaxis protein